MSIITLSTAAAPSAPSAGNLILYAGTDKSVWAKNEDGLDLRLAVRNADNAFTVGQAINLNSAAASFAALKLLNAAMTDGQEVTLTLGKSYGSNTSFIQGYVHHGSTPASRYWYLCSYELGATPTLIINAAGKVGVGGAPDDGDAIKVTGSAMYTGDLHPVRSAVEYTGSILVPLTTPIVIYNGQAFSTGGPTEITAATMGIPSTAKAIVVEIETTEATPSTARYFAVGPSATYFYAVIQHPQVASTRINNSGVVPCSATGSIYYNAVASGVNTLTVTFRIWGYFI